MEVTSSATRTGRASHGTNSLPSSARLGQSHALTCPRTREHILPFILSHTHSLTHSFIHLCFVSTHTLGVCVHIPTLCGIGLLTFFSFSLSVSLSRSLDPIFSLHLPSSHQAPPTTWGTARRGSRSPPPPATLALCWAPTEVQCPAVLQYQATVVFLKALI